MLLFLIMPNLLAMPKYFCSFPLCCSYIQLCILNVINGKSTSIPMVQGPSPANPESNCGIHSLEFNPSRTMLATGGKNPNDLSVYKVPEFEPVCLGVVSSILQWLTFQVLHTVHHFSTGLVDFTQSKQWHKVPLLVQASQDQQN